MEPYPLLHVISHLSQPIRTYGSHVSDPRLSPRLSQDVDVSMTSDPVSACSQDVDVAKELVKRGHAVWQQAGAAAASREVSPSCS